MIELNADNLVGTVKALIGASPEEQEAAIKALEKIHGVEVGGKARELLKAEKAKLARLTEQANKAITELPSQSGSGPDSFSGRMRAAVSAEAPRSKREKVTAIRPVEPARKVETVPVAKKVVKLRFKDGAWYQVDRDGRLNRWEGPPAKIEPKIELRTQAQAKPEPAAEPEPQQEEPEPEQDRAKEWDGCLDKDAPLDTARTMIGVKYQSAVMPTLKFWQHEFWEW